MKIEEALKYIDNAIDYWVEVSDYDDKQKDIRKTANTVTKIKINKRTGKVKTKTRKRRGQKTGEFFASLVGK